MLGCLKNTLYYKVLEVLVSVSMCNFPRKWTPASQTDKVRRGDTGGGALQQHYQKKKIEQENISGFTGSRISFHAQEAAKSG